MYIVVNALHKNYNKVNNNNNNNNNNSLIYYYDNDLLFMKIKQACIIIPHTEPTLRMSAALLLYPHTSWRRVHRQPYLCFLLYPLPNVFHISSTIKIRHGCFLKPTRFGTLIVATIYLQLIQNRYMFRNFTVLQCSHQHCLQPAASDVEVVGYL